MSAQQVVDDEVDILVVEAEVPDGAREKLMVDRGETLAYVEREARGDEAPRSRCADVVVDEYASVFGGVGDDASKLRRVEDVVLDPVKLKPSGDHFFEKFSEAR